MLANLLLFKQEVSIRGKERQRGGCGLIEEGEPGAANVISFTYIFGERAVRKVARGFS